jgi:AbrB family looped-hinge helix DNA binding protein
MGTQTATINDAGELVIPAEMRVSLGILPGASVVLTLEENRIVLRPVNGASAGELRGMFPGGPSLEDELYKDRRSSKW